MSGSPRAGLAALDASTGAVDADFAPTLSGSVGSLAISSGADRLFAAGLSTLNGAFVGGLGSLPITGGAAADVTAPTITIASPTEGQRFPRGSVVASSFACADAGSGVATCSGPATLDTAVPGNKTFTVTATDIAGNTASKSVEYVVETPAGGTGGDVPSNPGGGGSMPPGGGGAGATTPVPTPAVPAPASAAPTPAPSVTAAVPSGSPVAVAPKPKATVGCKPPKLRGKTLTQAKTAIAKAECKLGKVTKPKRVKKGSSLVVTKQSGTTTIAISLGAKGGRRR